MTALMSMFRPLAGVLLIITAAIPASAEYYVTEKNSRDQYRALYISLAQKLAPIADQFGCAFAWADTRDTTSVQLEFVPQGHDVRTWTRMVTVNTLDLPATEVKQLATLKDLQAMMMSRYRKAAHVLNTEEGADKDGLPTLFVEYEIGSGAAKEHNAAAIMKLNADLAGTDLAGIIQVQSRSKTLAQEDIDKMRNLANLKQDQE